MMLDDVNSWVVFWIEGMDLVRRIRMLWHRLYLVRDVLDDVDYDVVWVWWIRVVRIVVYVVVYVIVCVRMI